MRKKEILTLFYSKNEQQRKNVSQRIIFVLLADLFECSKEIQTRIESRIKKKTDKEKNDNDGEKNNININKATHTHIKNKSIDLMPKFNDYIP